MVIKSITGVICTCLGLVSINAGAAILSVDWQTEGDNLITRDTTSGLEWLDLTATTSQSYNDVSSRFGAGQEFEGWRYATQSEAAAFFDAFGGNSAYYNGWSTQNNGLFDIVSQYWGQTACDTIGCSTGDGQSIFLTAEVVNVSTHSYGRIYDYDSNILSLTQDYVDVHVSSFQNSFSDVSLGSALVRVSAVPVPAAFWLFGSGLIAQLSYVRRK